MEQKSHEDQVKREQIKLLYEALPKSLASGTLVALTLSYFQLNIVESYKVAAWFSLFLIMVVVRFYTWRWYLKHQDYDVNFLARLSLSGAIFSGAVWGSSAIFMFSEVTQGQHYLLPFALAGMSAGSVAVLSYRREQAWWFITLTLLPITIQWLFANDPLALIQAIMTIAFAFVLYMMASITSKHSLLALTAEIKAEQAAKSATQDRDFLQLVLDTIPSRVFWKDSHSKYIGGNRLFAEDAGYESMNDILGKSDAELSWGKDADNFFSTDQQVLKSGKNILRFEEKIIHDDGEERWREISKTPIKNSSKQVIGLLGTYHDITEKREIESQLRQAQKMEAIGTLVGGIAHEFNNILTSMTGNIYLARKNIQNNSTNEALEKLEFADDAGERAAQIIRQLMTLSRKDKHFLKLTHTDLNPWLKDAINLSAVSIPANIKLHVHCDHEAMNANADTTLLLQILLNLIHNACDAVIKKTSPEIHVSLSIEPITRNFQRKHHISGAECIKLSVTDNGTGISKAALNRIFEPFYTTKDVGEGTGLGLSTVQGAMQSHHGCIEVESIIDEGTTFSLFFPRLQDALDQHTYETSVPSSIPRGNGEVILVADDEPDVLQFTSTLLQQLGYQTLTAQDGKQALSIFQQHKDEIQLVLLDVVMPNMLGSTAAKHIRAIHPDIPLVFNSGYSQEDIQSQLNDAGDFVVLMKPFRAADLGNIIHQQLNNISQTTPQPLTHPPTPSS